MKVEIWSDLLCPFCYIGKRKFERALERFAHREEVEVVWRSFELMPDAPRESGRDMHDLLAAKLGGDRARARALKEYGSGRWYGSAEVDHLSEREAQVIAARLVNRAKARLDLTPEKLEALTRDLSGGIAAILTRDKGEECARDPFEGLTKIASKHLDQRQLAELRKAAEQGAGALPGESR